MNPTDSRVLCIKIGQPVLLRFDDGSEMESAIRKQPVESVKVDEHGLVGNDVDLKAHHGGVDKAVFLMSADSFEQLNRLTGKSFGYEGEAVYCENLVLSGLNEENVRVGDVYQIGTCLLEIAQPRRPCSRLSKNSSYPVMKETIFASGLTGWYARVIKDGEIRRGNSVILQQAGHPDLSIMALNRLLSADGVPYPDKIQTALDYPPLAEAFKRSLRDKLNGGDGMVKG
ncbi:MOSC domain-containing protein YiiM [Neisseria perflava]|uniref:MOSC domain-containing protein n=1 Tax=Neisseria perflava TaxID=33053 RepID=UPI0020A11C77|nr:MOSC domain-containing protein [Neisseria perflava]MCP1771286.1 MOSC domain-containing protein YiiM [Neisseria perflava]